MKKIMLSAFAIIAISSAMQAQQRNCGTMENLELRKKENPALEQKMADDEKRIAEWILAHPAPVTSTINLPSLKGFAPTGNIDTDRVNYAIAKESYVKSLGRQDSPVVDQQKRAILHEQKRKNNSFINK